MIGEAVNSEIVTGLRILDPLPTGVVDFVGRFQSELSAMDKLSSCNPVVEAQTNSFREELLQNAAIIWTYREEVGQLLSEVTGKDMTEEEIVELVKASILTDLGKVGTERLQQGQVPDNIVARTYHELIWTIQHVDWLKDESNFNLIKPLLSELDDEQKELLRSNGRGRTVIPFRAAIQVMKQVALKNYPEKSQEIDQIFQLSQDDVVVLEKLGLNENMPLARVYTLLHCRAAQKLFPKLEVEEKITDLALGHHFSAGLDTMPRELVLKYGLDGAKINNPEFVPYVAKVALLSVLDRLQAFVQRSKKSPVEAVKETVTLFLEEVETNYGLPHSRGGEIEGIFAQILAFAAKNQLVNYY